MKTPRDILFSRHQAAAPKLDTIRREIVEELNSQATKEQSWFAVLVSPFFWCFRAFWCELFVPCRRIWTGLAAVWILLFIVNFAQRDSSRAFNTKSPPRAEVMMAFDDQEKILNELLADRSVPAEADRPKNAAPRPRGEIAETVAV